jgi:hypothetical protein
LCGAWGGNSSTFEYDVKQFSTSFDFFGLIQSYFQTCVVTIDLHNSQFEKEENNMFGVRTLFE